MPLIEPEPQDFSRKQTEPYRAPQVPSAASTPEIAAPSGAFSVTGGSAVPIDSLLKRMNYDFHSLSKWDRLQAIIEAHSLSVDAVEKLPLEFWTETQAYAQRIGCLGRLNTAVQSRLPKKAAQPNVPDEPQARSKTST